MGRLWEYFNNNGNLPMTKWKNYFPIYERYFNQFINQSITLLEIGVFKGGSLQMWKNYLGPYCKIIGIDIDPRCKQFEEDQIDIRIGDQSNPSFLKSIITDYPNIDIIIDDGSHIMNHVIKSFNTLYPYLNNNGIYLIEDMHTSYWDEYEGGLNKKSSVIEYSKTLIDSLNKEHIRNNTLSSLDNLFSIAYYDSIIVFEKKNISKNISLQSG
jgi:cephalosporin hydroxylase